MRTRLNPYLTFPGNAREAMEFYRTVFGGDLRITTFGDLHAADDPSENDLVIHSMLIGTAGLVLMASDTRPSSDFDAPQGFSVSLSGDDEEELGRYWSGISAGGVVGTPFEKSAWGAMYGTCVDTFGIAWIVNAMPASD